ncbi:MAG TPA: TolC family protein [Pyrinomonadaceae bacterium]|nr:TolC family protein [Pyrinomonadaceae bacterium]
MIETRATSRTHPRWCCFSLFVIVTTLMIGPVISVAAQEVPNSAPNPTPQPAARNSIDTATPISLNDAIELALRQASPYAAAQINQKIASEDVRQARAAFLPKVTAPLTLIYTTPSLNRTTPREPSFLGANAITEYQGLVNAAGEIDTSGRLTAALRRGRALVESARAGSEVARRELVQSVVDAYFNLALSTTKRRGAESNLRAAVEFENNTRLQLEAGEVAPVDLVRARLQTAARRDELAQAATDEAVNGDALRGLIAMDFSQPIVTTDLLTQTPSPDEIQRFSEATISSRPEFAQFEAERHAAEFEAKAARAERLPQLTYSVSSGFITDSLTPVPIKDHLGVQATIGFTIPIFDWGASRSREAQARLRTRLAENSKQLSQRQFVQAFHTARTQALAAQDRIAMLNLSITDAESNVNASLARYRAGEAAIVEVVDAQNLLVTQRQALYQALFDYQTAKSRLARAAGQ